MLNGTRMIVIPVIPPVMMNDGQMPIITYKRPSKIPMPPKASANIKSADSIISLCTSNIGRMHQQHPQKMRPRLLLLFTLDHKPQVLYRILATPKSTLHPNIQNGEQKFLWLGYDILDSSMLKLF